MRVRLDDNKQGQNAKVVDHKPYLKTAIVNRQIAKLQKEWIKYDKKYTPVLPDSDGAK